MKPQWKSEIRRRLAGLHLAPTREAAIVEELAQYLEDCFAELLAGGASRAEAYAQALAELSDSEFLTRELRRMERQITQEPIALGTNRRTNMIADLCQDLRFGARMLAKQPGFTLIATLTLALGIGVNTAIFSVVDAVLLRPLPFREAERLMMLGTVDSRKGDGLSSVSYPNFVDLRAQSGSFERLAVFRDRSFTLTGSGEPARLKGVVASADLFALLGVSPSLGRSFRPEEDNAGASVVILSHGLWRRRFNSDPQVIGRNITLDDRSLTVVGVAPAGFQFPIAAEPADLWTTIAHDATGNDPMTAQRGLAYLSVIGRLKPGVSGAQAQAEMDGIARSLERQYPDDNAHHGARLAPALEQIVGDVRRPLLILFGAVGCVLLIACANVANLLLARATARRREIALRAALGASRGRVIRQLLTESVLLALAGSVCGWLLAWSCMESLLSLSPENIPRLQDIRLDGRVFGFTLLVSLLTGAVFGLAPALQAAKTELTETLKEGGRSGEGARGARLRGALIIAEVAVALVLMAGAGLLLNSFWRLLQVNPGFDPRQTLTFRLSLPASKYSGSQAVAFFERLQARLQNLPGVRGASVTFALPFGKGNIDTALDIEGRPVAPGDRPHVECQSVLPDYFRTLGIRLIKGRDFNARDDLNARRVAIINEALARRFFPNEDPIGKRIRPGITTEPGDAPTREIIGVVSDVRYLSLTADVPPEIYMPYPQFTISNWMRIALRTDADPRSLISAARVEVQALDKELPVFEVKTLDQYVSGAVAHPRFNAILLLLFAGVALLLTAVGIYGVISYSVTQRTREIGIRMALGAPSQDMLRLVVKQGMTLTLIGVGAGLGGALALTRLLKTLLFGVSAADPLTFSIIVLSLIIVAFVACWLPARRATKVDPLVALRQE
ncbi:MAG TPA: ABC transporter permease [Blastocatellia bacterium]|nr:ABC transporter permease [Blastocatellia bacterium]